MSGLPTRRFAFEAFLPRDKKERAAILQELKDETRTIIIYEAPHHLVKTLEELYDTLGDRQISICRELTKRYEEKMRTTLSDSLVYYGENEPRGEYVLVIHGKTFEELAEEARKSWEDMSLEEHMQYMKARDTAQRGDETGGKRPRHEQTGCISGTAEGRVDSSLLVKIFQIILYDLKRCRADRKHCLMK